MQEKYLLIGQPRSGTTYLSAIFQRSFFLNHSGAAYNEQIKKINNTNDIKIFLNHVNSKNLKHPVVVKEHLCLLQDNNIDITQEFNNFYRIKIIRKNISEIAMSMLIARELNKYEFWTNEEIIFPKFIVNESDAKESYSISKKRLQDIESLDIETHQTIYYEDLTGDPLKDQLLFPMFQNNPIKEFDKITVKTAGYQDSILNYNDVLEWFDEVKNI